MRATTPIESILKKDRALVLAGVVAVAALAWAYLFYLAWDMRQGMSQDMNAGSIPGGMNLAMTPVRAWTGVDFLLMFLMWAVMMTAMMVPTAAPMILTFSSINRKRATWWSGAPSPPRPPPPSGASIRQPCCPP